MRSRAPLYMHLAVLLATTCAGLAHADAKDAARERLHIGVQAFQAGNYSAALAEFEASFRELPSAASLQNIALCQTRLFRYVEALEALDRVDREFGTSLSAEDRLAIRHTRDDLSRLVGELVLRVTPPDAEVTLNGHPVDAARLGTPMRVSSGEYRVEATEPGYSPASTVVDVAGGEHEEAQIVLRRALGELSILASDPSAAIAIDRQPLAYGAWSGSLAPGVHLVQVYKVGHLPSSTELSLHAGENIELRLPLGPIDPSAPEDTLLGAPELPYADKDPSARGEEPPPTGVYGLLTATSLAILRSPDGFTPSNRADTTGGFFGARVGYRFNANFAFEGLFESGGQDVDGTLRRIPGDAASTVPMTYELTTNRYGGNVRLLAGGRTLRFSGTFGVGAVHHTLLLDGGTYKGTNSYLGLEAGPQMNFGKAIVELAIQACFEGATGARRGEGRIYSDHTILPQVGVGLRVGYGEWGRW